VPTLRIQHNAFVELSKLFLCGCLAARALALGTNLNLPRRSLSIPCAAKWRPRMSVPGACGFPGCARFCANPCSASARIHTHVVMRALWSLSEEPRPSPEYPWTASATERT
jgi:hypothetical protein